MLLSFILIFSLFTPVIQAVGFDLDNSEINEGDNYLEEPFDDCILTSQNVIGAIPENVESLLGDIGTNNCIIADIKPFSTFSLRSTTSSSIEIDVSELDNDSVDILHFIEDASMITDDMAVLNVSNYEEESKDILRPAIMAYQEKYDSNEECVVLEIFEDLSVTDGVVSFSVDSFSIFAVGSFDFNYYEFYVDGVLYNKQVIIENGILLQPETPYKENCEFLGWQIEGETDYLEFGNTSAVGTDTIKCNAVFNAVTYVYFLYEAKEGGYVLDTLSGKAGETIYTDQVDYPINLDKHVISWHTDVDLTSAPVESVVLGDTDIILYPNIQEGHWLTFYTNGGSLIEPHFYAINETVTFPTNPVKEGYTFKGWVDENNNPVDISGQYLTENMVLQADWEANLVNYTVQIVMQNPDEQDEYDPVLGGIFTKQALAGSVVAGGDIPESEITACINGLAADSYFKGYLKYFYRNSEMTENERVEIEGDGSTVIHIYYDRYVTELRFFLSYTDTEPYTTRAGLFDQRMAESAWPTPSDTEFPGFAGWEQSKGGSRPTWNGAYRFSFVYNAEADKCIYNLYAVGGGGLTHAIKYYVQAINPDGTVPEVGVTLDTMPTEPHIDYYNPLYLGNEGKQELIDNWSNIDFKSASVSEVTNNGAWVLDGMDTYTANGTHTGIAYRHNANSIPGFTAIAIGFDLYNNVGDGTEYRMDNFKDHPNLPNSYIDYWATSKKIAQGMGSEVVSSNTYYYLESNKWYAVSEPFRAFKFFGDVYVRLLRNIYNIQFIVDGNKVADYDVYYETDMGIDKFTSISEGLTPPAGYIFGGWYTSPSFTEDTRFYLERNTMPYNDLILYAKWVPVKVELDVHITIDGSDTILEGFNSFTVKYGDRVNRSQVDDLKASVDMPTDAIWYGWYEKVDVGGGKKLLVPFNFDAELVEDLVLYPFYSYATPISLTYDLNGGTGTTPIDEYNYAVGKGAVVKSSDDIVAPDGKVFIYWNTEPDGSGKSYYPGDIAIITEDKMPLYAIYGLDNSDEKVAITYVNNEGSEEMLKEYNPLDSITILNESIFSNIPEYKVLKEWNTEPDGSGISYSENDNIMLTGRDNKLYAIWEYGPDYKIVVNYINGFTSEEKEFTYQGVNNTVLQDESVFTNPVDSKYVFDSWNTKADGSGTSYNVGDTVTHVGKIDIYAIWKINPAYRIAVIYENPLTDEEKTVEYFGVDTAVLQDSSVFDEKVASKYIFKGWNTVEDGSGISYKYGDIVTPNTELKLYAMWEERVYRPSTKYTYTIYYKDADGNELSRKEVFSADLNKVVTVKAKEIDGYICKDNEKSLKITRNSNENIIIFEYEKEGFIPPEHKYLDYSLNHKAYVVGYEDGTVRPDNNITRAETATIFYRLLKESVQKEYSTNINNFSDVLEGQWFNTSVSTLARLGLVNGYSDGSFKPNQYITRAEFVSMMIAFFDKEDSVENDVFSDISDKDWFYNAITAAIGKGFVHGYPDNTFKPNQYITRAEVCKIVNEMLDRRPTKDGFYHNVIIWPDLHENDWFYLDMMEATNGHIADYNYFKDNLEKWNK